MVLVLESLLLLGNPWRPLWGGDILIETCIMVRSQPYEDLGGEGSQAKGTRILE